MTVFYPFKASLIFNVCDYAMQICFISIAATKQTVSEKNVFSGKAETGDTSYSGVCLVFNFFSKRNLIIFLD